MQRGLAVAEVILSCSIPVGDPFMVEEKERRIRLVPEVVGHGVAEEAERVQRLVGLEQQLADLRMFFCGMEGKGMSSRCITCAEGKGGRC